MRVAYLTDTDRLGGAERVLVDMMEGTVAAGHDVVLLCPQQWLLDHVPTPGARRAYPTDRRRGLSRRTDGGPAWRRRRASGARPGRRAARPARRAARQQRWLPGRQLCRLVLLTARVTGARRRILTVHAVPRPREEGPPGQLEIDGAVWRCVDVVVGGSRAVDDGLQRLRGMPPHLFRLLPYGVRPPERVAGEEELRGRLDFDDDDLLVGMVSATSDVGKGHAVFVEAVARTPGAHGIVVGAPPPEDVDAVSPTRPRESRSWAEWRSAATRTRPWMRWWCPPSRTRACHWSCSRRWRARGRCSRRGCRAYPKP